MRTETEEDWEDCPLFAPEGASIPQLPEETSAEKVSSAVAALSHLLYDEETPLEASELLRDEGNRYFKRGRRGYRLAITKYNEAITAAADVPDALAPALLNRSMAEFRLENYGRALQDVEQSLALIPGNVKAHYRALLCALQLEKFDIALRHCETGLNLARENDSAQGRRDVALFRQQKMTIEKGMEKSTKDRSERESRLQAEKNRKQNVDSMIQSRGITMGLPLFAQQRRYSSTEPVQREGVWHWPVLLVYPEDVACPGNGDQSDFLEDIAETTTMEEILQWIFGEAVAPPSWDMNRLYRSASGLQMRYRTEWTMKLEDADSDDEESFCGSTIPAAELGHWVDVNNETTVGELLSMRNYITPMFPVLYVVPRGIELR